MNYYPVIRGRQYDLLALAAAVKAGLDAHIIPVIEPVKDIAALPRVIQAFAKAQHPLYILTNPQVGQYGLLAQPKHALPVPLPAPIQSARYFDPLPAALYLTQTFQQVQLLATKQLALVPNTARVRALKLPQAIYLEDHYPTRHHTADFYWVQDEFYQYPQAALPGTGFADYPLSTHTYDERGYPQRAIAFHLLYPKAGALWLHHFTSVNNEDLQDPGTKFFEARASLAPWLAVHPAANTPATTELLALDHFPGLGTLRKLQLQHWFTIIGRWLR